MHTSLRVRDAIRMQCVPYRKNEVLHTQPSLRDTPCIHRLYLILQAEVTEKALTLLGILA